MEVVSSYGGRPTFRLREEFRFTDTNGFVWVTEAKWRVDGATILRAVWTIVGGPMSGRYLYASIIHDKYCDTKERTAHDTHRNFYYGMRAKGVSPSKARLMHWAVRTFGPSWKVVKPAAAYGISGPTVYTLETESVAAPAISEDQLDVLLEEIDPASSLEKLDRVSDATRIRLRSEKSFRSNPLYCCLQKLEGGSTGYEGNPLAEEAARGRWLPLLAVALIVRLRESYYSTYRKRSSR
ncbi:MAG: DUF1353 domain-containing protein [Pseudomonadota bacterium]